MKTTVQIKAHLKVYVASSRTSLGRKWTFLVPSSRNTSHSCYSTFYGDDFLYFPLSLLEHQCIAGSGNREGLKIIFLPFFSTST